MAKLKLENLEVTSFETSQKKQIQGGHTDPAQCGETFTGRPTMCTSVWKACFTPNCNI